MTTPSVEWFVCAGWSEFDAMWVRDYEGDTWLFWKTPGTLDFHGGEVPVWASEAYGKDDPVALHRDWLALQQGLKSPPVTSDGWIHLGRVGQHELGYYYAEQPDLIEETDGAVKKSYSIYAPAKGGGSQLIGAGPNEDIIPLCNAHSLGITFEKAKTLPITPKTKPAAKAKSKK